MYHLVTKEEQLKALNETKRVLKPNGILLVAYVMNEYAVIIHGFRDNYILENIKVKNIIMVVYEENLLHPCNQAGVHRFQGNNLRFGKYLVKRIDHLVQVYLVHLTIYFLLRSFTATHTKQDDAEQK